MGKSSPYDRWRDAGATLKTGGTRTRSGKVST
jgi:hypothetical protein